MSETNCADCHDTHWSPTRTGLKKWELKHHKQVLKDSTLEFITTIV